MSNPRGREAIYSALWNLITADAGVMSNFVTASRYLRTVDDLPQDQMPALFMFQRGETWIRPGRGVSPKRTLRAELFVYVYHPETRDAIPSVAINDLLDYLDVALGNPGTPAAVQTLGDLVEHVYIEGDLIIAEGVLQGASVCKVPITMLIP